MFEMSTLAPQAPDQFNAMYVWGLSIIHVLQSVQHPAITLLARFFTLLGDPVAYVLVLPILFWCVDERRGFLVGMTAFISNGINIVIKNTLQIPRPFTREPAVQLVAVPDPYSTPSGHTQNAAAFWPTLFATAPVQEGKKRHRGLRIAASLALPFCIGISRIYLGVHYPTDVLLGWAIGGIIACVSIFLIPAIAHSANDTLKGVRQSLESYKETTGRSFRSFKLALVAFIALGFNALSHGDSSMGGLIFGFGAGYIFLTDNGNPRARKGRTSDDGKTGTAESVERFTAADGTRIQKIERAALGLAVLAAVYFGLKFVLPGEGSEYYALCRFLRYCAMGLWASLGAPKLFMKLKLV